MYDLFAFVFQNSFLLRGSVLFVLGIIIGSFLNVVVYRLPIMLKYSWQDECIDLFGDACEVTPEQKRLNLIHPSSHCPLCHVKIPFWANVPILGYFFLNGKCFNCKNKISIRYPLVEMVTGLLFICAGFFTNDIILLPAYLIFICFVICLILIDFDAFLLPDQLTLLMLWLGLLFNIKGAIAGSLFNALIGAVVGYLFLYVLFWLFKLTTKRDGMGYGDFKFLAALLAWLGYQSMVPLLFIASMLGICYFILAKLSGKLVQDPNIVGHHVPFGPFLGIAGLILLFATDYINFLPML